MKVETAHNYFLLIHIQGEYLGGRRVITVKELKNNIGIRSNGYKVIMNKFRWAIRTTFYNVKGLKFWGGPPSKEVGEMNLNMTSLWKG